ncbi:MAG: chitinase [Clostridia bacterium]|nr:chitinase [Clostridia bacterium]
MPAIRPRTKDKKDRGGRARAVVTMMLLSAAAGVMVSSFAHGLPAAAEVEKVRPEKLGRTVMYLMDSADMKLRDADADSLDQLNVSFALIRDGEADVSHWRGQKKVTAFLKKHPHVDGVLSLGGWGADGFSDACQTEEGRRKLADSILRVMDDHGFVGVDIDWEYPGVSGTGIVSREGDVEGWYGLLEELRAGLDAREQQHGREYILSVALGAGDAHLNAIDPARLDGLLDQAVVMAYDLRGFDRTTGHHAGLYPGAGKSGTGAHAVETLITRGLSPEKILLGMPAYGRMWRQVTGGGDGLNQRAATSGNKTISYEDVQALESEGYTRYYDEAAQAAYWFDGANFVSAEDEQSIRSKCSWLVDKGLQGVAVWQYTQDASGGMLRLLHDALVK